MRTQYAGRRGINHEQFNTTLRQGGAPAAALLAALTGSLGLALDSRINGGQYSGFLPRHVIDAYNGAGDPVGKMFGDVDTVVFDAQPELVTVSNAGIPAYLANYLDPALIEVLVSPMNAALIAGETKKGDWTTDTAQFIVIESDGQVSAYGDYSNDGNADFNTNFPSRQSFHYQTFTRWGEKEVAKMGLAGIDAASRKNVASALILNKFQNKSYFFGISGLANYGLLNSPDLLPPILPSTAWSGATAEQGYQNILELYTQLVRQANGLVNRQTQMTLAMSPQRDADLARTNQYGLNVYKLMKENFPGITVKTAPEYSTSSGELMQLIVDEMDGQETMTAAFTEKMRAHAVVVGSSSFSQKKSQGTWGTIIFRPVLIAQSLG